MRRLAKWTFIGLAVVAVLIQALPLGRPSKNPPVVKGPPWNAPATEALARKACFDCHSNETRWPWYAWVAPVSWLVTDDVEEGRRHLNFSRFDQPQRHADDAAEEVRSGDMPPSNYLLLHPDARLSDADRAALSQGLEASFPRGAHPEREGQGAAPEDAEGD